MGFTFKRGLEKDIYGGRDKYLSNDCSGKIWTRDDNSAQ